MKDLDFVTRETPAGARKKDTLTLETKDTERLRERILEAREQARAADRWVLESPSAHGGPPQRNRIRPLPFRIGRGPDVQLSPSSPHVSKAHAEIYSDGQALRVRDLGSRNGTFLNRQPITDAALHRGDILHFGDREYRIALPDEAEDSPGPDDSQKTLAWQGELSRQFPAGAHELPDLLVRRAVEMVFQPIVELPSRRALTCEALGRGRHPGLPTSPIELFEIAAQVGPRAPVELSQLFRRRAVEQVLHLPEPPVLFLNTHPAELQHPGLLESLEELRATAPHVDLVLEIHESALAQTDFIVWLRTRLMEINVGLAFDDFGAGQARLFELAEAPPHYLKFDRRFISGIDRAPTNRQRLVASLVAAARELTVRTVAEGVETEEEAAACIRAGFSHAQGYYFARPGSIDMIIRP
jgi:EAL domain-containing protein (putative c-di-GMP-specific phosphodiesterase class I)